MNNWYTCKQGEVRCVKCDAVLMSEEDNKKMAPSTAGLYTSSNSAESWWPDCVCGSSDPEHMGGMKPE